VIFYHEAEQATLAVASKAAREVARVYARPIVTEIRPATTFWPAEDYHQQYIAKGGAHHCHVFTRTIRLPERSRDRSGTAEVG
jgi:peptide-methionine (S)-S-oxide reductase